MIEDGGADRAESPRSSRPLDELVPGVMIADRYRLEEPLGRGAMGVVMAARHVALDQRVALKFLQLDDRAREFRTRFAREARVCAKLQNEHVVRVIDFGTWRDTSVYMAMECLEGEDLRTLLLEGGRLEVDVAVDYVVQACEGLAEVHANGVVHRDLKPSNLFVTKRSDGTPLIKILDFGISKWVDPNAELEAELTETGAVLGTPRFMSPEQLFGSKHVDAGADVWSLGAILYQLLTGEPPFEASTLPNLCARLGTGEPPEPPSVLRPEVTTALDAAVLQCLEHDVNRRTANVAELAGNLLAAIGSRDADAVRERLRRIIGAAQTVAGGARTEDTRPSRSTPSYRRLAVASIAALLTLAAIVAFAQSRPAEATAVTAPLPVQAPSPREPPVTGAAIVATAVPTPSPVIVTTKPTATALAAKPKPTPVTPPTPTTTPPSATPAPVPVPPPPPPPPPPSAKPGILEERQ